jgi:hypothetical protein
VWLIDGEKEKDVVTVVPRESVYAKLVLLPWLGVCVCS